ncbi:alpha/beta fold hydrolase [Nocardia sp. NPDC059239]|uniref:alpha/beta fold hydrolase n=1 Tax=unclassified Nocardia TaxID=2637762 RepID=UPI00369C4549
MPKARPRRLRRRLKWTAATVSGLVAVLVAAALVLAYLYHPGGVENPRSAYLSTVDSQFVDTELARFHYVQAGSGSPVVLVHGGGEWAYSYRDTIQTLARSHRVIAVDLPGHGYTELHRKDFAYTVDSMAGSLAAFLDALGLTKVSLAGHSWGGGWALRFAETRPDRVERLALIDSNGVEYSDVFDWRVLEYPVVGEVMMNLMSKSSAKSLLQKSFYDPAHVTDDMADEYWAPSSQPTARTALLRLQREQRWADTEHDLGKVIAPTLVIWGSGDAFIPRSVGERLSAALPGHDLRVLDGCGHSSVEECPAQGNPLLDRFFSAVG